MKAKIPPENYNIKYINNNSRIFFPDTFLKIIIKLQMMNHLYHEGFEGRESTCNYCQTPMEQRRFTS